MNRTHLVRSLVVAALAAGIGIPIWSTVRADEEKKPSQDNPKTNTAPAKAVKAPPAYKADPKARELLDQMTETYSKLNSYAVTLDSKEGGPDIQTTIQFKKPNKIAIHTKIKTQELIARSDGKNLYAFDTNDKTSYQRIAAPETFDETLNRAVEAAGAGIGVIRLLLMGQEFMPPSMKALTLGTPGEVNGTAVETVIGEFTGPKNETAKFTFSIGKADHLLRRIKIEVEGEKENLLENHTDIKVNPQLADSVFEFQPPAGAKEVEQAASQEPSFFHPDLKPGATPFPIQAKDTAGKPVTLDQYKGKVLLMDFWATWCGPCIMEMPNVQKVYTKYKKQGFDVLGVSLDHDQASLNAYVKKNKLPWRQVYDAGNPDKSLADKYQVQGIPFALLIGKDGKIVAVNLRGDELDRAVKSALAKK